jgi:hypothetical protein
MAKNFSKTMNFETFKKVVANTPEMMVNAFLEASREYESLGNKVKVTRGDIINHFLKKNDRFLFVYENLESFKDYTASEVVNMMKSSAHWDISKCIGENSIVIRFANGDDYFRTNPIKVNDFINFLNE